MIAENNYQQRQPLRTTLIKWNDKLTKQRKSVLTLQHEQVSA